MALELDSRYPGRFNPGDADYPQGSFKNRTAPGALDGSYLEKDWANDKEGFFQRLLLVAGISPNGNVDTALASQYYSALVQIIQANNTDTINAAIATVAAAGTINLTTGAPGTSQLAISGTGVSISGFTVAANRFFIVKMTGAINTLVNSASLVTGRGANIPVVAGDCFLMRSTAANTVEIVGGTFLVDRAIGSGQTVQQFVSPNRLPATDYTNLTGQTIWVCVNTSLSGAATLQMRVDGLQVDFNSNPEPGVSGSFSVSWPVPNGSVYRIERTGTANTLFWFELRKP